MLGSTADGADSQCNCQKSSQSNNGCSDVELHLLRGRERGHVLLNFDAWKR